MGRIESEGHHSNRKKKKLILSYIFLKQANSSRRRSFKQEQEAGKGKLLSKTWPYQQKNICMSLAWILKKSTSTQYRSNTSIDITFAQKYIYIWNTNHGLRIKLEYTSTPKETPPLLGWWGMGMLCCRLLCPAIHWWSLFNSLSLTAFDSHWSKPLGRNKHNIEISGGCPNVHPHVVTSIGSCDSIYIQKLQACWPISCTNRHSFLVVFCKWNM